MTNGWARQALAAVRRLRRPWDVVALLLLVACVTCALMTFAWTVRYALAVNRLASGVGDVTFFGADGRPWFQLDEHRRDVPLDAISPYLQQAVIATEDRRFYYHPGIDPLGVLRAVRDNIGQGEAREGASTLTQQLARTLFLSNARTIGRKGKEAILALMIELRLSKAQILELYLNRVYLSAGVYGVEAMSTSLFNKHARDLTLAEAALMAGLVKAPSALSPWSNLDGAVHRSDHVLARMQAAGFVTSAEVEGAKRQHLRISPYPAQSESRFGYAKEWLRQEFRDRFGGDEPPDWEVHTTVLPALQDIAEQSVAAGLARLGIAGLQAALVALDPETGHVLAIVGGRDFRTSTFNRASRSKRQPGSAFKPIVYATALENGSSPVTVLKGLAALSPQGIEEWTPRNVSGTVEDRLTLRQAFIESNNRAAVALQQQVGARAILRMASSLGIDDQPDVPSLALGSGLVTPLQLTAAYAAFPNGGFAVKPSGLLRVLDDAGQIAFEETSDRRKVLPDDVAFQLVTLMTDVVDRGTGTAVRSRGVRFPVGGKTGTTSGFKDAWFVGYSAHLVTGVWVGFDQPAEIREGASGSRVALPIWADFMRRASRLVRPAPFLPPDGMRAVELCHVSYLRPVDGCPIYTEYFKAADAVPSAHCQIHGGSVRQRAERIIERVVGGLLGRLWQKVKGE
jgi:1A family penicillin-binding protein